MPRRAGQLVTKLEPGTMNVGVAPTDLGDLEVVMRSTANRIGGPVIVAAVPIENGG